MEIRIISFKKGGNFEKPVVSTFFLDKRLYIEDNLAKEGELLFF